jgi:sulfide:quinone oxidoreductase
MSDAMRHRVVVIGGGSAGITVAARLRRLGEDDVAIVEPSAVHYYQPLWTLVGAGAASAAETERPESSVMPRGVRWTQDAAVEIDPDRRIVHTRSGARLGFDALVVAAGIQLDWDEIPGLTETLGRDGVSSNYRYDLAPRTWQFVREFRGGTALFTDPSGPHKCGGASQKAAYISADAMRRSGVLRDTDLVFVTPSPSIFGVPEFARVLEGVVERYGIDTRFGQELVEVRPATREAVVRTNEADPSTTVIQYDLLHVVPPQSAPDFLKASPLAVPGDPKGWVDVDRGTLQHVRYPEVFALGDCAGSPNSKTGAAARKQAPVVAANVVAQLRGLPPTATYDGYSSCPIVTGYGKMLLAEFDYTGRPHPTIPLIDTVRERYDMWLLKRYGLPFIYWHLMLRGLA